VILILGDHQPVSIQGLHVRGYLVVPALLFDGPARVSIEGRHMWELPWLIWSRLSGRPVPALDEPTRRLRYEALLARHLRPSTP